MKCCSPSFLWFNADYNFYSLEIIHIEKDELRKETGKKTNAYSQTHIHSNKASLSGKREVISEFFALTEIPKRSKKKKKRNNKSKYERLRKYEPKKSK